MLRLQKYAKCLCLCSSIPSRSIGWRTLSDASHFHNVGCWKKRKFQVQTHILLSASEQSKPFCALGSSRYLRRSPLVLHMFRAMLPLMNIFEELSSALSNFRIYIDRLFYQLFLPVSWQ